VGAGGGGRQQALVEVVETLNWTACTCTVHLPVLTLTDGIFGSSLDRTYQDSEIWDRSGGLTGTDSGFWLLTKSGAQSVQRPPK
jgi:hypothetical protein